MLLRGRIFFRKDLCCSELLGGCNEVGIKVIYSGLLLPLLCGNSNLIIKYVYADTIISTIGVCSFILHLS